MYVVKILSMIFLSIYLILSGLSAMSDIAVSVHAKHLINWSAIIAGVLILVSLGRCCQCHRKE